MRSIVEDADKNLLIINIHVEQVFNSMLLNAKQEITNIISFNEDSLSDIKEGIYVDTVNQSTYDLINKHFPQSITGYKVCLYWSHINDHGKTKASTNALDRLVELVKSIISKGNTVDFACTEESCLSQIKDIYEKQYFDTQKSHVCDEAEVAYYKKEYERILDEEIDDKLLKCREDYNDISESSRVRLKYYINVKPMIEDIEFFSRVMYKLAMSLREKSINTYHPDSNKNIALVVTSLNGGAIGSVLAQLFGFEIIKIDHLGPRNELFINSMERFINRSKEYYIIADVICMGREVNTAKSIINMYGAKCRGCITLVNIVPTGNKPDDVHCLVNIDHDHNKIGYEISIDL